MIATTGEIRIAYDDTRLGPPLVLLHGFPHDRTLWNEQRTALAGRVRSITPDMRGFGESDATPPYSMDRFADDVAALLDSLSIERAVIGGVSMGGYVTLAFWRRHRHRVAGLALVATRATADTDAQRERRAALADLARRDGARAVARAQLTGMLGRTTRATRPDVVARARAMMERAPIDGIIGALEAMSSRPDSTPYLATIDVPTTIIAGDEDETIAAEETRAMARAIRGSNLVTVPHAGHLAPIEQPEAVNAALDALIRRSYPDAGPPER